MDKYIVYKHTSPNGKVYIGITKLKPNIRWRHGNGYSNNIYFTRAIKKYGWENFKHEILFENLTENEAKNKEIELIKYYKSTNSIYGYNKSTGGETCKGTKKSEEAKKKISDANKGKESWIKGKHHSNETKMKIGLKNKGNTVWLGRKHSEESRKKMSNIAKERYIKNPEKHFSRKIKCITTGKIFNSIREAGNFYNCDESAISKCCRGKRNYCGTYCNKKLEWEYIDVIIENV